MDREENINSLRIDLLAMVEDYLTPVALRYGYSDTPLEANIKWRPLVLVLGNYSSGKSTLINDFIGSNIQATGQAPTDDSFTVITCDDTKSENNSIRVTEERDGQFLLNDLEYPFESLKKHGQRFVSHFRLKKVNSPFLKNLAIIDTPGMLDSITERDRGYNYQQVIGDLAQIADLVLILFDPHKAGTVREAHTSLRDTLPDRTFENRILFVLNRIDECVSLMDLLQVYGTLCWNLSQMTGRKDIPTIHLVYSPQGASTSVNRVKRDTNFLYYLKNQREELKQAISQAPRFRLDHLASFVETHGERLSHLLEGLISYRSQLRRFRVKSGLLGLLASLTGSAATILALKTMDILALDGQQVVYGAGAILALIFFVIWTSALKRFSESRFHRQRMKNIDKLTPLENQTRLDSWKTIRELVNNYLKKTKGRFPFREIRKEYSEVHRVFDKGAKEIREALAELSNIKDNESEGPDEVDAKPLSPSP